jgi:hypothetical protein
MLVMTQPTPKRIPRYMSRTEVATYLGLASVKSLSKTKMPRADVIVGDHKGWTKATIDKWNEERPGPGWHGARDEKWKNPNPYANR